jgi:Photoprotection regulator fluorescence recovery protein
MAARIKEPDELWELERHLTQRRKEIDAKSDFKYSALLLVLADLVRKGCINLDELHGLAGRQAAYHSRPRRIGGLTLPGSECKRLIETITKIKSIKTGRRCQIKV